MTVIRMKMKSCNRWDSIMSFDWLIIHPLFRGPIRITWLKDIHSSPQLRHSVCKVGWGWGGGGWGLLRASEMSGWSRWQNVTRDMGSPAHLWKTSFKLYDIVRTDGGGGGANAPMSPLAPPLLFHRRKYHISYVPALVVYERPSMP